MDFVNIYGPEAPPKVGHRECGLSTSFAPHNRQVANYLFRMVRCGGDDSGVTLWGRPYPVAIRRVLFFSLLFPGSSFNLTRLLSKDRRRDAREKIPSGHVLQWSLLHPRLGHAQPRFPT